MVSHVPCHLPLPFNMQAANAPFLISMRLHSTVVLRFVSTSPTLQRVHIPRSLSSRRGPKGAILCTPVRTHKTLVMGLNDDFQRKMMTRKLSATWRTKKSG